MSRLARGDVFSPDEEAIVHVTNRVVRRCFLLGIDPVSGKNFDHRKAWIEDLFRLFAACFGIDLLAFSILSNHFHLVLRSRPSVVKTWSDDEVARRWLTICPIRKNKDGTPKEPTADEINALKKNTKKLAQVRRRLSDISWWMRLICQRIATRANREDKESGKFWQSRFHAVRILDDEALLACAAYVDLNPIRAALAETLAGSDFSSTQRRIESLQGNATAAAFLAPIQLDQLTTSALLNPATTSASGSRCSEHGFLPMSLAEYLELLDWTAQQTVAGRSGVAKPGESPKDVPPILVRLAMDANLWCDLVENFGELFSNVAGKPQTVDEHRTGASQRRCYMRTAARQLFAASPLA